MHVKVDVGLKLEVKVISFIHLLALVLTFMDNLQESSGFSNVNLTNSWPGRGFEMGEWCGWENAFFPLSCK